MSEGHIGILYTMKLFYKSKGFQKKKKNIVEYHYAAT